MIVPTFTIVLLLVALSTATAASMGAAAGKRAPASERKVDLRKEIKAQMEAVMSKGLLAASDIQEPQLRGLHAAAAAPKKYASAIVYAWYDSDICVGNATDASYFSGGCSAYEDGTSMRYNCDEDAGAITAYKFPSLDCSGTPLLVQPFHVFTKGECTASSRTECSTNLMYGMEESLIAGHYTDSSCTGLLFGFISRQGCNGNGEMMVCSDGVLNQTSYLTDDCTGDFYDEDVFPLFEQCVEPEDDDGDDDEFDDDDSALTTFEMGSCSAIDVMAAEAMRIDEPTEQDDDDAASAGVVLSRSATLLAIIANYAFMSRA